MVNVLVIVVLSKGKNFNNSQSVYKISLAAADLLVGVFVLPTCVFTFYTFGETPLIADVKRTVTGYQIVNESYVKAQTSIRGSILENLHIYGLTVAYFDGIGFFTTISIFVSVYTLAGAGFDRFMAVRKPLSYDKARAKKIAKVSCLISWAAAVFISTLPFFDHDKFTEYEIHFTLIVISGNTNAIILYVILFFIPFLIVWVINISVYIAIKKHNHSLKRRMPRTKTAAFERKLAATLRLMVGVFTLNTLPLCILLLCNFFFEKASTRNPEIFNPKASFIFDIFHVVAILLLLGNSFCNFFIYNSRNEDFRKCTKEIILDKLGIVFCWQHVWLCLKNPNWSSWKETITVCLIAMTKAFEVISFHLANFSKSTISCIFSKYFLFVGWRLVKNACECNHCFEHVTLNYFASNAWIILFYTLNLHIQKWTRIASFLGFTIG